MGVALEFSCSKIRGAHKERSIGMSAGASVDTSISEGERHAISECSVGCGTPETMRARQGMSKIEIGCGTVSGEEGEDE